MDVARCVCSGCGKVYFGECTEVYRAVGIGFDHRDPSYLVWRARPQPLITAPVR